MEKQHPTALLLSADQHSCHKDNTDTNVDSAALEKHLTVDAPKNPKTKKNKKRKKKNLNYELNAFLGGG